MAHIQKGAILIPCCRHTLFFYVLKTLNTHAHTGRCRVTGILFFSFFDWLYVYRVLQSEYHS